MRQIITCFLLLWSVSTWAVTNVVDLGIFNVPAGSNKFEIRIKPTQTVSGSISSMVFTVRFLSSYNVTLDPESFAPFNFALSPPGLHPSGSQGGYDYYSFSSGAFVNVNWTVGVEVVVAKLYHSNNGSGGQGTFELIEDSWTNDNLADFYIEGPGGDDWAKGFYQPTASAPLPVELSTFDAILQPDKTVALNWQSQSEVGFSHYGIEHSINGISFREIGKLQAQGDLQQAAHYQFIHTSPAFGKNYYRLRMVDLNGYYEFSPIRAVELSERGGEFTLGPIPTPGPLILHNFYSEHHPADLQYQLTDVLGKILETGVVQDERTLFDLSDYSSGIYYLNLLSDVKQVKQFKIVLIGK